MPSYRVYLLSELNRIIGRGDFASRDDEAAIIVAELVSVASPDQTASYELWRESLKIGSGKPSAALSAQDDLDEHIRKATADATLALNDSRWRIAESRRLLEAD